MIRKCLKSIDGQEETYIVFVSDMQLNLKGFTLRHKDLKDEKLVHYI